jgi:beta-lactamase class A
MAATMLRSMHSLTKRALALAAPAAVTATLLTACSSTSTSPNTTTSAPAPTAQTADSTALTPEFAKLETEFHAQLGLYAINTGTGRSIAYQADRRFAYCSTIKAFAASVLLQRDTDEQLGRTIAYSKSDLVDYSPVTSQHVDTGMPLAAVMAAALDISDNTALNLMLKQIAGPSALQAALRGLGDTTTNVDRTEPTVNAATPGDPRDTSTARALATDLRAFALGDALSTTRRAQLVSWLQANTTGGPYIRAAVPTSWKVGDRTGNGDYGTRNDIAVLWPPTGAPIVIAVLSNRGDDENAASDDALIADATKLALRGVG